MICDHIGAELTPVLRRSALGTRGEHQDGRRLHPRLGSLAPSASPLNNFPICFCGEARIAGKSPSTKLGAPCDQRRRQGGQGVDQPNEFNGELAGAIICAVEEKEINKFPHAYVRI